MTGTVLILGANGRFGRAATRAFSAAGWQVRAATRSGQGPTGPRITPVVCDVMQVAAVQQAARGADVIVHAVNPGYQHWARLMPTQTENIIAAGLASGVTVMIPGNVYIFGENAPEIYSEDLPCAPTTRKGALRVAEQSAFEQAAAQGLQTVILRGGDFIEGTKTGSWFENHIVNKAQQGRFTYPGRMDVVHAWAYLPDMARAMVLLAQKRTELPCFARYGFEGFSLTGEQLRTAVAAAVGKPLKPATIPWPLLRVIGVVNPVLREVIEMRYLWDTPHRIDGTALRAALPDFVPTPLSEAMASIFAPVTPGTAQRQMAPV